MPVETGKWITASIVLHDDCGGSLAFKTSKPSIEELINRALDINDRSTVYEVVKIELKEEE